MTDGVSRQTSCNEPGYPESVFFISRQKEREKNIMNIISWKTKIETVIPHLHTWVKQCRQKVLIMIVAHTAW